MIQRREMRPWWPLLMSCGLLCLAVGTAGAQDIIRFDDQAGGAGSPAYPGMPEAAKGDATVAQPSSDTNSKDDKGNYSESTVFRTPQGEASSAQTEELLRKEPKEIYSGIIPGKRDGVKHIDDKTSSGEIKWIGFLAEKTRTRVFIQTNGAASYETSKVDNKLVFTFSNSSLAAKNFSRHIDTRFYGRAVKRIETNNKKKQKIVEIVLTIDANEEPRIDKQGEYIYVDFKYSPPKKNGEGESAETP